MTTENEKQAVIRRGMPLESLSADDRLAWANAASPITDAEPEAEPVNDADDGYTDQARKFLAGRDPATLDLTDSEILAALNSATFRKPVAAAVEPARSAAPAYVPFELDTDKINAAGMSPDMRAAICEAFARADIGRKEIAAGTHPAVRTIKQHQYDAAMLRVGPYLRKAA